MDFGGLLRGFLKMFTFFGPLSKRRRCQVIFIVYIAILSICISMLEKFHRVDDKHFVFMKKRHNFTGL